MRDCRVAFPLCLLVFFLFPKHTLSLTLKKDYLGNKERDIKELPDTPGTEGAGVEEEGWGRPRPQQRNRTLSLLSTRSPSRGLRWVVQQFPTRRGKHGSQPHSVSEPNS